VPQHVTRQPFDFDQILYWREFVPSPSMQNSKDRHSQFENLHAKAERKRNVRIMRQFSNLFNILALVLAAYSKHPKRATYCRPARISDIQKASGSITGMASFYSQSSFGE
jgi:hypothetical protein